MENPFEKMQRMQRLITKEAQRLTAAETASKARLKLLDAAIMLGDPAGIEAARLDSQAAFEAFLDVRIAANRRIRELQDG